MWSLSIMKWILAVALVALLPGLFPAPHALRVLAVRRLRAECTRTQTLVLTHDDSAQRDDMVAPIGSSDLRPEHLEFTKRLDPIGFKAKMREADLIIVAPARNFEPRVFIFNNKSQQLLEFLAYNKNFRGGVSVAAGQ